MILKAYTEALGVAVGETVTSGYAVKIRGEWGVIRGTDGMLNNTSSEQQNIVEADGTTRVLAVPFLSNDPDDPNRTKTVISLYVFNADTISHTIRIGVDNGSGLNTFRMFTVPVNGSVVFHDKSGWDLRDADGHLLAYGA